MADNENNMEGSEPAKFECNICQKEFSTSFCLQIHVQTHKDNKSYDCHECGKTFSDFPLLFEHLKEHILAGSTIQENEEKCNVCEKEYPKSQMEMHKRTHVFKPGLTCDTCGKSFGSSQVLKLHSRTHESKVPFKCQVCGLQFASRNLFTQHWNTHPAEFQGSEMKTKERNRRKAQQHANSHKFKKHQSKYGKRFGMRQFTKKKTFDSKEISSKQSAQAHSDREEQAHSDAEERAHSDRDEQAHSDREEQAHSDGEEQTHSDGEVQAHSDIEEQAHSDREEQAHSDGEEQAHSDGEEQAHSDMEEQAHSDGEEQAHSDGEEQAHSDVEEQAHSDGEQRAESDAEERAQSDIEVRAHSDGEEQAHSDGEEHVGDKSCEMRSDDEQTPSKQLKCSECNTTFTEAEELRQHKNMHLKDYAVGLMRILSPDRNINLPLVPESILEAMQSMAEAKKSPKEKKRFRDRSRKQSLESADSFIASDEDTIHEKNVIVPEHLDGNDFNGSDMSLSDAFARPRKFLSPGRRVKKIVRYKEVLKYICGKNNKQICMICKKEFHTIEKITAHIKSHLENGDEDTKTFAGDFPDLDRLTSAKVVLEQLDLNMRNQATHSSEDNQDNSSKRMRGFRKSRRRVKEIDYSDDDEKFDDGSSFSEADRFGSMSVNFDDDSDCNVDNEDYDDPVAAAIAACEDGEKDTNRRKTGSRGRGRKPSNKDTKYVIRENYSRDGSKYQCNLCPKTFYKESSIYNHVYAHIKGKMFNCKYCGQPICKRTHLAAHEQVHEKDHVKVGGVTETDVKNIQSNIMEADKFFKCCICDFQSKLRINIYRHVFDHIFGDESQDYSKTDHGDEEPNGGAISQSLKGDETVNEDSQMVTKNYSLIGNRFRCGICLKTFNSQNSINTHMMYHLRGKKFHCKYCGKDFSYSLALKRHEKQHANLHAEFGGAEEEDVKKIQNSFMEENGSFKCCICDAQYTQQAEAYRHVFNHFFYDPNFGSSRTNDSDDEDNGTRIEADQDSDEDTSTGTKPKRKSKVLEKIYQSARKVSNAYVKKYLEEEDGLYKCLKCQLIFKTYNSAYDHVKQHLVAPFYKCSLCSHASYTYHCLEQHLKSHTKKKQAKSGHFLPLEITRSKTKTVKNAKKFITKEHGKFKCKICNRIVGSLQSTIPHVLRHLPEPRAKRRSPMSEDGFSDRTGFGTDGNFLQSPNQEKLVTGEMKELGTRQHLGPRVAKRDVSEAVPIEVENAGSFKSKEAKQFLVREDDKIRCTICSNTLSNMSSATAHVLRHKHKMRFKCPFCDYHEFTRHHVMRHIQTHSDTTRKFNENDMDSDLHGDMDYEPSGNGVTEPPTTRSENDYSRQNKGDDLKKKIKDNTSRIGSLYRCKICSKLFDSKTSIKYHLVNHLKEKKYKCKYCGFGMERESQHAAHEMHHLKVYESLGGVSDQDLQNVNANYCDCDGGFRCLICNTVFKYKTNVYDHVLGHVVLERNDAKANASTDANANANAAADTNTKKSPPEESVKPAVSSTPYVNQEADFKYPYPDLCIADKSQTNTFGQQPGQGDMASSSNMENRNENQAHFAMNQNNTCMYTSEDNSRNKDMEKPNFEMPNVYSGPPKMPEFNQNEFTPYPFKKQDDYNLRHTGPDDPRRFNYYQDLMQEHDPRKFQDFRSAMQNVVPPNMREPFPSTSAGKRMSSDNFNIGQYIEQLQEKMAEDNKYAVDDAYFSKMKGQSTKSAYQVDPRFLYDDADQDFDDNGNNDVGTNKSIMDPAKTTKLAMDFFQYSMAGQDSQLQNPSSSAENTMSGMDKRSETSETSRYKYRYAPKIKSAQSRTTKKLTHDKIVIVGEKYCCAICKKEFALRQHCYDHVEYHAKNKHQCPECDYSTPNKTYLSVHIRKKHRAKGNGEVNLWECKICHRKFTMDVHLRNHMQMHSDEEKITILNYCKCQTCGDVFRTSRLLFNHKLHHLDPIECKCCKLCFSSVVGLQNHLFEEGHYQCEDCKKVFSNYQQMDYHNKAIHHQQFPYSCDKCEKKFLCKSSLNNHLLTHETHFECAECSLTFTSLRDMNDHQNDVHVHTKNYVGQCEYCLQRFTKTKSLDFHRLIHQCLAAIGEDVSDQKLLIKHTVTQMVPCVVCRKQYPTLLKLKDHLRLHVAEKKYKCEQCGLAFAQRNYFKIHQNIHNNIRPFKCDQCPRAFASMSYLRSHIKDRHLKVKVPQPLLPCEICGKEMLKTSLKSHLETHNQNRSRDFPCKICHKLFYTREMVQAHEKRHNNDGMMCDICGLYVNSKYALKNHRLGHTGEKPFICHVCGKKFKIQQFLRKHMLTHSGIKKYVCNICNKAFMFRDTLKNHIYIHTGEQPYQCHLCGMRFKDRWTKYKHVKQHKMY